MTITADDLIRFQESGARIEAEINTAKAERDSYKANANRYLAFRNATNAQKLKLIQSLAKFEGADLDNAVDTFIARG